MKITEFETDKKYKRDWEDVAYLYVDVLDEIHLERMGRPLNLNDLNANDWVEINENN